MPNQYQAEFRLNGQTYTATAGLRALAGMHEMTNSHPQFFEEKENELRPDGPKLRRLIMTEESAPALFELFTDQSADYWRKEHDRANPLAVVQAWGVIMGLLDQAHDDWDGDEDNMSPLP